MWKKEKKQETQEASPEKEEGRDLYEWCASSVWTATPWCPPCRTETGCWC